MLLRLRNGRAILLALSYSMSSLLWLVLFYHFPDCTCTVVNVTRWLALLRFGKDCKDLPLHLIFSTRVAQLYLRLTHTHTFSVLNKEKKESAFLALSTFISSKYSGHCRSSRAPARATATMHLASSQPVASASHTSTRGIFHWNDRVLVYPYSLLKRVKLKLVNCILRAKYFLPYTSSCFTRMVPLVYIHLALRYL